MRAKQNAVGIVQGQEGADRQLAGREHLVESGIAIQLALGGKLGHLPPYSAFGAHMAAVERIQCLRVAAVWLIATAEAAKPAPALRRRATPAKADPAQLHRRKTVVRVVLQLGHCTPCCGPDLEPIGAMRGRILQQRLEGGTALRRAPAGRQGCLQVMRRPAPLPAIPVYRVRRAQ